MILTSPKLFPSHTKGTLPGGAEVAQGTLNPLTLVRIQAGQPKLLVIRRPNADTAMLERDIS